MSLYQDLHHPHFWYLRGLENRRGESHRGFESHPLRHIYGFVENT